MVLVSSLYYSPMERNIQDQSLHAFDHQVKQLTQNENIVFETFQTFEQKKRMLEIGDKGRFLIFMITLPLSKAYDIFYSMSYLHQNAFLTMGKMNTSLEFIRLTPYEKDLFLELQENIRHEVALVLNRAMYYRHQKNASYQYIYSAVMTPEQIIYNFKMYGLNASQYEIKYIQFDDSSQKFEIKNCEFCGYTVHHCFGEKMMQCMNCDKCCS